MTNRTLYYTHNINPRVAVAVARHLNSPVDLVCYEPMGADREAFLPLNPNSLAPLLVEPVVAGIGVELGLTLEQIEDATEKAVRTALGDPTS